jgi:hypothetical protein
MVHKPERAKKMKGSVAITNKLWSIQWNVAKVITGGLSTVAGDISDIHAFILPVDLLFQKLLFRSVLQLCSLPPENPLHPMVKSAAKCRVKHHPSSIHFLTWFVGVNLRDVEKIAPVRRGPGYTPVFKMIIPSTKEEALPITIATNALALVHVYSDSSRPEHQR